MKAKVEAAKQSGETLEGFITGAVKGGVDILRDSRAETRAGEEA